MPGVDLRIHQGGGMTPDPESFGGAEQPEEGTTRENPGLAAATGATPKINLQIYQHEVEGPELDYPRNRYPRFSGSYETGHWIPPIK